MAAHATNGVLTVQRNGHVPVGDGVNGAAPAPAEGRDSSSGRFVAGNRYGKGNPHARRMAALRQAFLSSATEERLKELGEKLLAAALAGDWVAAKLYLGFVIGRPGPAVDIDRLDLDEWKVLNSNPPRAEVLLSLGDLVCAEGASEMLTYRMACANGEQLDERLFGKGVDAISPERRTREVQEAQEDRRARARKR